MINNLSFTGKTFLLDGIDAIVYIGSLNAKMIYRLPEKEQGFYREGKSKGR